ncbi:MAG: hypothetical protein WAZ18_00055 [Alphaproteobacteria bacterium]
MIISDRAELHLDVDSKIRAAHKAGYLSGRSDINMGSARWMKVLAGTAAITLITLPLIDKYVRPDSVKEARMQNNAKYTLLHADREVAQILARKKSAECVLEAAAHKKSAADCVSGENNLELWFLFALGATALAVGAYDQARKGKNRVKESDRLLMKLVDAETQKNELDTPSQNLA